MVALFMLTSNFCTGGVFIVTSSIAGTSTGGSSMAYSVTKAAQLHMLRCLAATQGKNVRTNAVLPGLLLTDWVREILRLISSMASGTLMLPSCGA